MRGQELDDGRLQAVLQVVPVVDLDIGQALGTVNADEIRIGIYLLAGQKVVAVGYPEGHHPSLGVLRRTGKHLEIHIRHQILHFHQFQGDTQVRLVRTVAGHGLGMGHTRKGAKIHVQRAGEEFADQLFRQPDDLLVLGKGELDIHLGEFRLAIGAQVLVPEALGDLEVAIHPRHHQQLLEQLRRLGKCKKLALVRAARHQVVPRTLRRGPGQHRRFHLQEATVGEEVTDGNGHPRTEAQIVHHFLAPQVQIAMAQAHILPHLNVLVELEGRCFRGVENGQFRTVNLDLAGLHIGIDSLRRTGADATGNLQDVFAPHPVGLLEIVAAVGVKYHLDDTFPVAQIDEDDAAVIPPPVHPAAKSDLAVD